MASFRDVNGREWPVTITVGTVRRVRSETGHDLMSAVGGDLLQRMADDPVILATILYSIAVPEPERSRVTLDAFCEALAGNSLSDAADAFCEALCDFFGDRGGPLRAALDKSKEARRLALKQATEQIHNLQPEQLLAANLETGFPPKKSGHTATTSPES